MIPVNYFFTVAFYDAWIETNDVVFWMTIHFTIGSVPVFLFDLYYAMIKKTGTSHTVTLGDEQWDLNATGRPSDVSGSIVDFTPVSPGFYITVAETKTGVAGIIAGSFYSGDVH
jgi:hypothetical protein